MRSYAILGMLAFLIGSANAGIARADGDQCPDCKPPTKPVCFNLVCSYQFDGWDKHASCKVAATFVKDVTKDGGEVTDDSQDDNNPRLEVSCDGIPIFNNSARRYTDLLGTRIQGQEGPDPAVTLPRGELHTGPDGISGGHYSYSTLELDDDTLRRSAKGSCFIWTGYP